MSAGAAVTRTPVEDGGVELPSNTIRPEAVAPFDVTMTTFERSSPETESGRLAASPSPPSPPPIVARNITVSPPSDVMIRTERTVSM